MGLNRRRFAVTLALLMVGSACTHTKPNATSQTSTAPTTAPGRALIQALPAGCDNATPTAEQAVTFVKDGRAWAADPFRAKVSCLFEVDDPGLFEWGPQADRVVLGGLAVRGVGSNAARPSIATKPTWFSWSRPKGVALVFTAGARTALKRADIGSSNVADLTPLAGATYGDIAYHPSGLAIGFVAKQGTKTGIWMAGNHGENPKELVTSTEGTEFGPIVFSRRGQQLLYGAHKKTGEFQVLALDLSSQTANPRWSGGGPIAGITEGTGDDEVAVTSGPCAKRVAAVNFLQHEQIALLGGVAQSATVVGWLPQDRFVVTAGPCDGPRDVYVTGTTVAPKLLVEHVDRVSMRLAEALPPPALPAALPQSGFA
jgi:hypothetical protein